MIVFVALSGCLFIPRQALDDRVDGDGDGFLTVLVGGDDCDDARADVHPGAADVPYDDVDSDCDGADDDDADGDGLAAVERGGEDCDDTRAAVGADPLDWVADCDGDGVPQGEVLSSCGVPTGVQGAAAAGCAPGLVAQWLPYRAEVGVDCDDADPSISPRVVDAPYDGIDSDCAGGNDYDADDDGVIEASFDASHTSAEAPETGDCDDTRPDVHPGADELWYDGIDRDCDGADDFDQDGDGHPIGTDCRDGDPLVFPGAPEIWYDGADQDCDGANDFDADGDGYATVGAPPLDCDDTDPAVAPGAIEVYYDGVDQDCDGRNDYDADQDGVVASGFEGFFGGSAPSAGDCDDGASGVHPGAQEVHYDGVDSDCDGANDFDADGDGAVRIGYEAQAAGLATGDCDDLDPTRRPGVPELYYDGIDSDCDGGDDFDADGDGAPLSLDCDDADPLRAPGLPDVFYDGVDSNCDGADENDADGDGSPVGIDCDDADPLRTPGRQEVYYDGVDADCDGLDDFDVDRDGVAWSASGTGDCDDFDPAVFPGQLDPPYDGVDADCGGENDFDADQDGVVAVGFALFAGGLGTGDCDDANPLITPGRVELWYDGIDADCDGANDYDRDGDGVVRLGDEGHAGGTAPLVGDCDDGADGIHPGVVDLWYDGIDADCDGADDYDQDGDGAAWDAFGGQDCDDTDVRFGPHGVDTDDEDRNCDGLVFEDLDGDGIAAGDDCDDTDPHRWIGGSFVVGFGDALPDLIGVACAGTVFEVPGTVVLDRTLVIDRPLTLLGQGRLIASGVRAIEVLDSLLLLDLTLEAGEADTGGCILARAGSTLDVRGATLEDCTATGDGGALRAEPGSDVSITDSVFRGNTADRGGAVHAAGIAVELDGVSFQGNSAGEGGALYFEGGAVLLTDADFVGNSALSRGGDARITGADVDLFGVTAIDSATGDQGAVLYLEDVTGRIEDLHAQASIAPDVFGQAHAAVFVTGGVPGGVVELEHVRISGVEASASLQVFEHRGHLALHDVEIGFHQGQYSLVVEAETEVNTLAIDNLYVHNHSSTSSSTAVHLYSLLGFTRDWALRNATITRNLSSRQLFVGCHACGVFRVSNVLTGSQSQVGTPSGVMWIDTFGTMEVAYTTTLYSRPWLRAYNGPEDVPQNCTACGTVAAHPFVAALPGVDVRLADADPLVGAGDPVLCSGSSEPDCLDPGFWGGPRPPHPR